MPQDASNSSSTSEKKQLPTLDVSQPVVKPKKPSEPLGDETVDSFAKRLRTRYPDLYGPNGKHAAVPDGKLVNDWLAKYPQYESRFKSGELYKANLSAYWDETKTKLGDAGRALAKLPGEIDAHPFGLNSPIARGLYETAAGPARELAGRPQPDRSVLSAPRSIAERLEGASDILLGGDPSAARMNQMSGRNAEAAADVFAVPIVGLLAEPLLRSLPGLRSGTETIGPTAKSNAALVTLMGHEMPFLPPAELAERTAQLSEIWKQAARETGVTDKSISKLMPSRELFKSDKDYIGAVAKGNQLALDIAERAVDITNKPIDTLIQTYGRERVGTMGEEIAQSLRKSALESADDGVSKALNKLAAKADRARTVADLNEIKKHANKESARLYGSTTGAAINSSAQTVYAYKLAGDAIRERLYPQLQKMAGGDYQGIDLIALGKRESDAIALRDGMQNMWHRLAGEQANKEALSFGQYVFGEGREHSLYSRHIYRRAAEKTGFVPGPEGMFNQMAKTATGELGKGAVGEKVAAGPIRQKALPPLGGGPGPGPNTFFFEIPTGLPKEVISPSTVRESMRYEGTRDLPRLDHEPLDPNSLQDTEIRGREEGSTGSQSYRPLDNKARRQAIGSASSSVPDRTFSGPATRRATQWQRIVQSEGGEVSREGGGTLRTRDLATAQATLDRLREYATNHPSEARSLQLAIDNLSGQIQNARAYQGRTPPAAVKVTPGRLGIATRNRLGKRVAIGMAGASAAGANERQDRPERQQLPPL
jgi:hypothetical protein